MPARSTNGNLQMQAVNEATFRCPDEDGWQPNQEIIDHQDVSLHSQLQTALPLYQLQGMSPCIFMTNLYQMFAAGALTSV